MSSVVPPAMNLDMSLKPLDDIANDIIEKVTDTGVKMVRIFFMTPSIYSLMAL